MNERVRDKTTDRLVDRMDRYYPFQKALCHSHAVIAAAAATVAADA